KRRQNVTPKREQKRGAGGGDACRLEPRTSYLRSHDDLVTWLEVESVGGQAIGECGENVCLAPNHLSATTYFDVVEVSVGIQSTRLHDEVVQRQIGANIMKPRLADLAGHQQPKQHSHVHRDVLEILVHSRADAVAQLVAKHA